MPAAGKGASMRKRGDAQERARRRLLLALATLACGLAAGGAQALGTGDVALEAHAQAAGASASAGSAGVDASLPLGAPGVHVGTPDASRAPAPLPLQMHGASSLLAPAHDALEQPAVAVGAGVGVAALLVLAARALSLAPVTALYSRLDGQSLLEHPTRRELLRIIGEEPGVNISDLHGRMGMGWGSLLYHLQRLEGQGLVLSHRWGRSRRYFLNERSVSVHAAAIRALKAENARALAEQIAAMPGATQEQLATTLGVSKSVVSKYAQRLEEASLVERQVGRNCLRVYPKQELRELLHTMPAPAPRAAPMHLPPALPDEAQADGPAA
jgi:predicted transcriptional regulator